MSSLLLQDTVAEMAKNIKAKRTGEMSASADELYTFINRVRNSPGLMPAALDMVLSKAGPAAGMSNAVTMQM